MSGRPARKPWASADLRTLKPRVSGHAERLQRQAFADAVSGETDDDHKMRTAVEEGRLQFFPSMNSITFREWLTLEEMRKRYPGFPRDA